VNTSYVLLYVYANRSKLTQAKDLMGGTSTGGIVAVLMAKLEMTASDGLEVYANLSHKVFGKDLLYTKFMIEKLIRSRFDANVLAEVIREELKKCLPNPPDSAEIRDPEEAKAQAPLLDPTVTTSTRGCRA
jgi:hypothetical protein